MRRWLVVVLAACGPVSPSEENVDAGGSAGGAANAGGTTAGGAAGGAVTAGGAAGASTGGGASAAGGAAMVGLFVATGHVTRSIVSCDDGLTWVGNQSGNDELRCFTSAPDGGSADCDHRYGAARGLAWTAAAGFVANFGWGDPGVIQKSRDGVSWSVVDRGANFASMVASPDGTLYAASRSGRVSRTAGDSWTAAGTANLVANGMAVWNVRRGGFGGRDGGVYVVVADSNTAMVSDDTMTWRAPQTYPATCGANIQWAGGVTSGDGVLLIVGGDGVACRSVDNGVTWSAHQVGGAVEGRLLWTGSEFMTWGTASNQRRVFRSADGASWASAALALRRGGTLVPGNGPLLGAVARSPSGTFVAVNGGWQTWYAAQRFYRSDDGVKWDELPLTSFVGSHPIAQLVWGRGPKPAVCP